MLSKRGELSTMVVKPKCITLEEYNQSKGQMNLGEHVVVIGGGNTAMDTLAEPQKNAVG